MPAPRIGQTGQKYQLPPERATASHTVSTTTTMSTYPVRCSLTDNLAAALRASRWRGVVAAQLGNGQIGQ